PLEGPAGGFVLGRLKQRSTAPLLRFVKLWQSGGSARASGAAQICGLCTSRLAVFPRRYNAPDHRHGHGVDTASRAEQPRNSRTRTAHCGEAVSSMRGHRYPTRAVGFLPSSCERAMNAAQVHLPGALECVHPFHRESSKAKGSFTTSDDVSKCIVARPA